MIVGNAVAAAVSAVSVALGLNLVSMLYPFSISISMLYIFGAVQLLFRNLWGFRLIIVASALSIIVSILSVKWFDLRYAVGNALGAVIGVLIVYSVLQIRKNGQSAWSQLREKWNKRALSILLPVFTLLVIGVWLIWLIPFLYARA